MRLCTWLSFSTHSSKWIVPLSKCSRGYLSHQRSSLDGHQKRPSDAAVLKLQNKAASYNYGLELDAARLGDLKIRQHASCTTQLPKIRTTL